MAEKGAKPSRHGDSLAAAAARQRRSAEALRANLRRRKTQARDRADDGTEEPDSGGLDNPSAKSE